MLKLNLKGNQYVFTIVGLQKVEDEPIYFSETYVGSKRFEKSNRINFLKAKKKYLMDIMRIGIVRRKKDIQVQLYFQKQSLLM